MRGKVPHLREAHVLEKNPVWYHCLNQKQEPRLDSETMLGYYTQKIKDT